ncbi:MAG: toxin-antitoxin system subunit antitoxin, partial [Deltaproteobacteria bacterium]|nr:toxin-antitoxin system subunit antitoxin [Deltaproteobacteria bacterium]
DEFQRLQATLDVLNDRPLMKQIRSSQSYYLKKKKGQSFEEVFGEPL